MVPSKVAIAISIAIGFVFLIVYFSIFFWRGACPQKNKQRAKQSLVELPLIISDHADWNELTQYIKFTGAENVYVTHGREEAIVHWCKMNQINGLALSLSGREDEEDL